MVAVGGGGGRGWRKLRWVGHRRNKPVLISSREFLFRIYCLFPADSRDSDVLEFHHCARLRSSKTIGSVPRARVCKYVSRAAIGVEPVSYQSDCQLETHKREGTKMRTIRLNACLQGIMVGCLGYCRRRVSPVPPLLWLPGLRAPRESSCLMIFICDHVVPPQSFPRGREASPKVLMLIWRAQDNGETHQ